MAVGQLSLFLGWTSPDFDGDLFDGLWGGYDWNAGRERAVRLSKNVKFASITSSFSRSSPKKMFDFLGLVWHVSFHASEGTDSHGVLTHGCCRWEIHESLHSVRWFPHGWWHPAKLDPVGFASRNHSPLVIVLAFKHWDDPCLGWPASRKIGTEAPADGYYRLKLDRLKWMSGDPEKPLSSLLFRGFQRKLNNTKASV